MRRIDFAIFHLVSELLRTGKRAQSAMDRTLLVKGKKHFQNDAVLRFLPLSRKINTDHYHKLNRWSKASIMNGTSMLICAILQLSPWLEWPDLLYLA